MYGDTVDDEVAVGWVSSLASSSGVPSSPTAYSSASSSISVPPSARSSAPSSESSSAPSTLTSLPTSARQPKVWFNPFSINRLSGAIGADNAEGDDDDNEIISNTSKSTASSSSLGAPSSSSSETGKKKGSKKKGVASEKGSNEDSCSKKKKKAKKIVHFEIEQDCKKASLTRSLFQSMNERDKKQGDELKAARAEDYYNTSNSRTGMIGGENGIYSTNSSWDIVALRTANSIGYSARGWFSTIVSGITLLCGNGYETCSKFYNTDFERMGSATHDPIGDGEESRLKDDEFDDVGDSRRRDNGAEKANGKEGMEEKNDTRLAQAPGSPANSRST